MNKTERHQRREGSIPVVAAGARGNYALGQRQVEGVLLRSYRTQKVMATIILILYNLSLNYHVTLLYHKYIQMGIASVFIVCNKFVYILAK